MILHVVKTDGTHITGGAGVTIPDTATIPSINEKVFAGALPAVVPVFTVVDRIFTISAGVIVCYLIVNPAGNTPDYGL